MAISNNDASDMTSVMEKILSWPAPKRLELAQQILATLPPAARVPRGPSANEVVAQFATTNPPPDDATVKQWLDEHRMEKFSN